MYMVQMEQSRRSILKVDFLVLGLLALSLAGNVYFLHWHGAELWRTDQGPAPGMPAGTKVPPLQAEGLDGQPREIRFDGVSQPTVLYVFTPTCGWCARNYANIQAIVRQRSSSYRFVGVALSGTPEQLASHLSKYPLGFEIVRNPSADSRRAYHLGATPQTVVVDRRGSVLVDWIGAYNAALLGPVSSFFGATLPGLSPQ